MPAGLIHLHQAITDEVNELLAKHKGSTEYHSGVIDVKKIVDKRFGGY